MPRPIDEPIPADEWLYRALRPDDVVAGAVGHNSIELRPACSLDRDKYTGNDPREVLERIEGATGIAVTQPRDLVGPLFEPPPPDDRKFRFEAADDPLDINEAHCEIRLVRDPGPYKPGFRVKSATLVFLQETVARAMRVVMLP